MLSHDVSKFGLLTSVLLAAPLAIGCPASSDDDSDTGNDTGEDDATAGDDGSGDGSGDGVDSSGDGMDGSGDDGTTPGTCPGSGGAGAEGEACTSNGDCASGVCAQFSDVPAPTDATCAAEPADCNTRITGTVFDFETGAAVGGATVNIAQALQAATNPTGAAPIVMGDAGADGRFDQTSAMPIMSQIGIVALVSADGYYLTATGVSSPNDDGSYNVGNSIHDFWAVSADSLATWSAELALDMEIDGGLVPLGDNGGVVGLIRDSSGAAVSGATVVPDNGDSAAIIRYLNADGTFGTDMSDTGIFIILAPGLAETFHVEMGGATVSGTGTAGSADGAAFTLVMTIE